MNTRKCWRRELIGRIVNLLHEEASLVLVKRTETVSPDPGAILSALVPRKGTRTSLLL
jgi:hypothetical protein